MKKTSYLLFISFVNSSSFSDTVTIVVENVTFHLEDDFNPDLLNESTEAFQSLRKNVSRQVCYHDNWSKLLSLKKHGSF